MNIIISEKQKSRLIEQIPDTRFTPRGLSDAEHRKILYGTPEEQQAVVFLMEFGTALFPVVGPFLSGGIGILHAIDEWTKGNKKTAGFITVLSSKVWAAISSKLSKGQKLLPEELVLYKEVAKNSEKVQEVLKKTSEKLSPLIGEIKKLRPKYIERFGQESYDELLKDFITGTSDRNYFLQSLRSGQTAQPKLARFISKFGIKFAPNEVTNIQKVVKGVKEIGNFEKVTLNSEAGNRVIDVITVDLDWVVKNMPKMKNASMVASNKGNTIIVIKENIENLSERELENLLYHEFAHIKDPAMVKSPKLIEKYDLEAIPGMKDWAESMELRKLGLVKKAEDLYDRGLRGYYFNPYEIKANNTKILQSFSNNTEMLMNVRNKDQILKSLDEIINFATKGGKMGKDAFTLLSLYDNEIAAHFVLLKKRPSLWKEFRTNLAKQANYLKSQIKIAK